MSKIPSVSSRAQRVPPSPIRKLVPFADKAIKEGAMVYRLNIGQPDIATPKQMIDAMKNFDLNIIAYGRSDGEPQLKREFSRYYHRNGIDIMEDQIIVTTGGSEAITFAMSACASPGEEILVFEPFYTNYNGFASLLGIELKPITTTIDDGFHLPPADKIRQAITDRTRAILICTPNNPTGVVLSTDELLTLTEIANDANIFIISDEVYREFCYGDTEHTSILQIYNSESNSILVDSISKRFSACGARIGCIASRNEEVLSAIIRMAQARLCPPVIEQIGTIAALRIPFEEYIGSMVSEFKARRDVLTNELKGIDGVVFREPEGAFYIQVKLPVENSEDFAVWMLTDYRSEHNETVMLAPGAGFYATEGLGLNEVRIAYVLNTDDIKRAINCLRDGLCLYKNRT